MLKKRLAPLYVAVFCQGFVLWYAIEKLYMKTIGFDDASIGIMVILYSVVMLVCETPSGILADRWSRKGVLILASVALGLSSLAGGLSDGVLPYMLCAGLWGVFYALYSGAYESIVYDTLLEETDKSDEFDRVYGHVRMVDGVAMTTSSLLGGLSAYLFGLSAPYFITAPVSIITIIALLKFREPTLHKSQDIVPITQHIRKTFGAILKRRELVPVLVVLISGAIAIDTTLEFNQLWLIALTVPVIWMGPINALHLSTVGIGGALARYVKLHRYPTMTAATVLMLLSSLAMVFSRNVIVTSLAIALLSVCLIGMNIVFTKLLHDALSSNIRAGAASAISTLGRIIIIPIAFVLTSISNETSIFQATWILVGLVLVVVVFVQKTYTDNKRLPELKPGDDLPAEVRK